MKSIKRIIELSDEIDLLGTEMRDWLGNSSPNEKDVIHFLRMYGKAKTKRKEAAKRLLTEIELLKAEVEKIINQ